MFARLSQFTAIALILVLGSQAYAGPIIYGTYYDESNAANCNSSSCRVNFAQLPSDKLLMVSQISCAITSTAAPIGQVFLFISATSGGASLSRQYPLSFSASTNINGIIFTNVQQNIHYLIGQGRFPFLFAATTSSTPMQMQCTIVGELVTPIQ